MKKSIISLLIFTLVFTMAVPAFANTGLSDINNSYAKAEIEALVEAGIISGYNDGTFKPANAITRAEFAKILALSLGLEEDPAAAAVFTDVPAWAAPYVGALVNAELTQGLSATTYGSDRNISRQELAVFFVRAWGLEQAAEEVNLTPSFNDASSVSAWAKAHVALAGEIGFINGLPNGNFDPTGNAQRQAVARLGFEFYVNSDEYLAKAQAVIDANKGDLTVTGVTASNLKEVYVTFNGAVDKDTVKDANFKVTQGTATVGTTATASASNNNTVVLSVYGAANHLENQGKYTLTLENVKGANGVELEKTSVDFTAFDAELPTAQDLVVTGPNSFDIIFSEPIASAGTVEVKSGNSVIGVNPTFTGYATNKLSVELYSSLVDSTTYEVTVKDFEDYAGYKNVIKTFELEYVKDETAPVAEVVKAEQTYVVVEFNKPVSGLTKEHFYHTFSAWTAEGIYTDAGFTNAITTTDKVSTVYVKFATDASNGKPIAEGSTNVVVRAAVGGVEIKDNWGNKFAGATFTVTVAADKVLPEVADIKVNTESSFVVTFNKNVKFAKANVEVLDADGKTIDGLNITVSGSGKEYTVNFGKNLAGKTIIVNLKNVEDTALQPNKLASYSTTLEVTDKTAPTVTNVTYKYTTNEQSLYVFFNESVNNTALVAGNYYLVETVAGSDAYTKLTNTPVFFSGDKVVRIQLTDAQKAKVDAGARLFVTNVEDVAGNALVAQNFSSILAYDADANKPVLTNVTATGTKTLELTFDQPLTRVDSAAFKVNSKAPAAMSLTTNSAGNTVVVLTTVDAISYDATGLTIDVTLSGTVQIQNVFGVSAKDANTTTVVDKIAPAIKTFDTGANAGKPMVVRTANDKIQITFTEAINPASLSVLTFSVANAPVTAINVVGGNVVELTINNGNILDSATPNVTQNHELTDGDGNKFKAESTLNSFLP